MDINVSHQRVGSCTVIPCSLTVGQGPPISDISSLLASPQLITSMYTPLLPAFGDTSDDGFRSHSLCYLNGIAQTRMATKLKVHDTANDNSYSSRFSISSDALFAYTAIEERVEKRSSNTRAGPGPPRPVWHSDRDPRSSA